MKIAILHHHLNPGGVTQVILNHLRGLNEASAQSQDRLRIAVLYGGRRDGIHDEQLAELSSLDLSLHAIPTLDYDQGTQPDDAALAKAIREQLSELKFIPDSTVLHVHNHSLGKNVSLPGAIGNLAREGYRFLLQIHDFAEDMRPANYQRLALAFEKESSPASVLYPQAPQIHYATLNSRDQNILRQAGVPVDRLHFLPNSVSEFGELPHRDAARKRLRAKFDVQEDSQYFLYPVRGIRRKNVGELLLWSAATGERAVFGITLPPKNPAEQTSYRNWEGLAQQLQLGCRFGTGAENGLEFGENLAAADAIITTSIAEGFGMVFLEAWLAGRRLVGRNLPNITADFVHAGMEFPDLYNRLEIPIEWLGRDDVRESLMTAHTRLLQDYGLASAASHAESAQQIEELLQLESIDFAMLSSRLQAKVIQHVHGDSAAREQIRDRNPALRLSQDKLAAASISANSQVVRQTYSLGTCGARLLQLYSEVERSDSSTSLDSLPDADKILSALLSVEQLFPIRFEG